MPSFDVKHDLFRQAVREIERRAERQLVEEKLVNSFVPNRVLDELHNNQNQLVFGRRGVGKTHTFKVYLATKVQQGELCHYIDFTSFGSGLGADGSALNIATRFFGKFLWFLGERLLDDAANLETPNKASQDRTQVLLEKLVNLSIPTGDASGNTFEYAAIISVINDILPLLNAERLIILLDEWAHIPVPAQPYVAEFLKRAFFSNPRVTLKLAVVDYMYRLNAMVGDNAIGLEKSADIFSDIRMDSYFVWDRDESFVETFFADVLFNHLALQLGIEVGTPHKLDVILNDLFTQRKAFSELCRASEGNARDFLIIFGRAHERFRQQASHENISIEDVQLAAVEWYRNDKFASIATERWLEQFMQHVVQDVIRERKSRTFMVPFHLINHPLLQRLFSGRLLHPLNIEWSHPHQPGERYHLVSMDYGSYASFKGTKNEPQKVFWDLAEKDHEDLVPLDNRKSIRHIVLPEDTLERFWAIREPNEG